MEEQATLQLVLDTQQKFQSKLGSNVKDMTVEELSEFIHSHSMFLVEETFEMLRELPYHKPWKDYSYLDVDEHLQARQKAREEWIDMFHFIMNIGLALGFTEESVREAYLEKNKLNIERQENPDLGYVN